MGRIRSGLERGGLLFLGKKVLVQFDGIVGNHSLFFFREGKSEEIHCNQGLSCPDKGLYFGS